MTSIPEVSLLIGKRARPTSHKEYRHMPHEDEYTRCEKTTQSVPVRQRGYAHRSRHLPSPLTRSQLQHLISRLFSGLSLLLGSFSSFYSWYIYTPSIAGPPSFQTVRNDQAPYDLFGYNFFAQITHLAQLRLRRCVFPHELLYTTIVLIEYWCCELTVFDNIVAESGENESTRILRIAAADSTSQHNGVSFEMSTNEGVADLRIVGYRWHGQFPRDETRRDETRRLLVRSSRDAKHHRWCTRAVGGESVNHAVAAHSVHSESSLFDIRKNSSY